MACPRCRLSRGLDPAGGCRCRGFYAVENGDEVVVSAGTPNAQSAGSTPAVPANPALECPDLPPSELELRGLWCWWW